MLSKQFLNKNAFSLKFFLLVCLPVLTFFSFLPNSAGADEPSHQATAWYAVEHLNLPKTNYLSAEHIPTSLVVNPCFVDPYKVPSIACVKTETIKENSYTSAPISNYALPYYVFVGIGQKVAIQLDWSLAPQGGRLAGLSLNLLILFFATNILAKYFKRATVVLFCALTPMSVFYLTVVNPSGWEISTSILFLAVLVNFVKSIITTSEYSKASKIQLMIAAALFVTARPLAIMWLVLVTLLVYSVFNISKSQLLLMGKLLIPSMFIAVVWNLTHRPGLMKLSGHEELSSVGLNQYMSWIFQSLNLTPEYFRQMVGVLGWGDVAVSPVLSLTWIVAFSFLAGSIIPKIDRPWLFVSVSVFGLVFFPAIIQTMYWNSWPAWWQGRYELPLLAPILVLLLLKGEEMGQKVFYVIGFSILLKTFMQAFTFSRYGFGLSEIGIPLFSRKNEYSNPIILFVLSSIFVQLFATFPFLRSTRVLSIQSKN